MITHSVRYPLIWFHRSQPGARVSISLELTQSGSSARVFSSGNEVVVGAVAASFSWWSNHATTNERGGSDSACGDSGSCVMAILQLYACPVTPRMHVMPTVEGLNKVFVYVECLSPVNYPVQSA